MMGNGNYGSRLTTTRQSENDARIAEIVTELKNQGQTMAHVVTKLDGVSRKLTEVQTQMGHMVTKADCANGRRELGDSLKDRMDDRREITNPGIQAVAAQQAQVDQTGVQPKVEPQQRGFIFWIGAISAAITILGTIGTASVLFYRTMDRLDRTEQLMIQINETVGERD
jgi:hypothetical protein